MNKVMAPSTVNTWARILCLGIMVSRQLFCLFFRAVVKGIRDAANESLLVHVACALALLAMNSGADKAGARSGSLLEPNS